MPEPTNLSVTRILRELEKLKAEALKADLAMLAYLLDLALVEARERQRD